MEGHRISPCGPLQPAIIYTGTSQCIWGGLMCTFRIGIPTRYFIAEHSLAIYVLDQMPAASTYILVLPICSESAKTHLMVCRSSTNCRQAWSFLLHNFNIHLDTTSLFRINEDLSYGVSIKHQLLPTMFISITPSAVTFAIHPRKKNFVTDF